MLSEAKYLRGRSSLLYRSLLACWLAVVFGLALQNMPEWRGSLIGIYDTVGEHTPLALGKLVVALTAHLLGAMALGLTLLAVYGAGWPLRLVLAPRCAIVESTALQLLLGWSALAILQQALGLAGLFFTAVLASEAAVFLLGGVVAALVLRPWRFLRMPASSDRLPAGLVLLLVGVYFILTRLPDAFEDPMLYHFAAPEHYLRLGKINAEPQNVLWHMPLACEMLFTIPIHLGGVAFAKLVNVGALITILLLLQSLARTAIASIAGAVWWASLWLVGSSVVAAICWQGKNDLVAAMFVLGAAWCSVLVVKGQTRWLPLALWFAGQALAAKLTTAFALAGLGVALVALRRPRVSLLTAGTSWAIGIFPLAGWCLQSAFFVGNPFYPFLSGLVPSLQWGPEYFTALRECLVAFTDERAGRPAEILAGLWSVFGDSGSVGLVALLPLAFLSRQGMESRFLKLVLFIAYALWLFSERNGRYLLPLLPWAALLASAGLAVLGARSGVGIRNINRLLAVGVVLFGLQRIVAHIPPQAWFFLAGQIEEEEFLARRYTTWEDTRRWLNSYAARSSHVLSIGEPRRLWFEPRFSSHAPIAHPFLWVLSREASSVDVMRKRVRQKGYTHCLYNYVTGLRRGIRVFPGPNWTARQISLYERFASNYMHLVYKSARADAANGGFVVYHFSPRAGFGLLPIGHLPSTEGMFAKAVALDLGGHPLEAARETATIGALMPGTLYWREILAGQLWGMGAFEEVISVLGPVARAGMNGENSWYLYGGAALNTGRYEIAVKALAQACLVNPTTESFKGLALVYLKRGEQRAEKGNYDLALRDVREATRLFPKDRYFRQVESRILRESASRR